MHGVDADTRAAGGNDDDGVDAFSFRDFYHATVQRTTSQSYNLILRQVYVIVYAAVCV